MPWHAKPSGGYLLSSTEGTDNALMMNGFMNQHGYSLPSQAAVIACNAHEGGYNPWRWGLDAPPGSVEYQGYGLFQFTPYTKYIGSPTAMQLEGYAPNMSVTEVTTGANPSDGWAQMLFMDQTPASDWYYPIWRTYWNTNPNNAYALTPEEYAHYRAIWRGVMSRWAINDGITQARFKEITNIEDAVFVFLGGFEGPAWPKYYESAVDVARNQVWGIISGDTPPSPPGPPTLTRKGMPIWMYLI